MMNAVSPDSPPSSRMRSSRAATPRQGASIAGISRRAATARQPAGEVVDAQKPQPLSSKPDDVDRLSPSSTISSVGVAWTDRDVRARGDAGEVDDQRGGVRLTTGLARRTTSRPARRPSPSSTAARLGRWPADGPTSSPRLSGAVTNPCRPAADDPRRRSSGTAWTWTRARPAPPPRRMLRRQTSRARNRTGPAASARGTPSAGPRPGESPSATPRRAESTPSTCQRRARARATCRRPARQPGHSRPMVSRRTRSGRLERSTCHVPHQRRRRYADALLAGSVADRPARPPRRHPSLARPPMRSSCPRPLAPRDADRSSERPARGRSSGSSEPRGDPDRRRSAALSRRQAQGGAEARSERTPRCVSEDAQATTPRMARISAAR